MAKLRLYDVLETEFVERVELTHLNFSLHLVDIFFCYFIGESEEKDLSQFIPLHESQIYLIRKRIFLIFFDVVLPVSIVYLFCLYSLL